MTNFVDQNGVEDFIDQNGVTLFVDQNGVFLGLGGDANNIYLTTGNITDSSPVMGAPALSINSGAPPTVTTRYYAVFSSGSV